MKLVRRDQSPFPTSSSHPLLTNMMSVVVVPIVRNMSKQILDAFLNMDEGLYNECLQKHVDEVRTTLMFLYSTRDWMR
jgi:hypothetical protein